MISVIFAVNILGESVTTAYAASDPEEIIREYFSCMGHDWNAFADLYADGEKEGIREFLLNEDCGANNVGILNVNNAEVTEIVEVAYQDIKGYFTDEYDENSVRAFVVGADYSVNEDSIFFSSGLIYNAMLLIQESDGLKIKEIQQIAYPEKLLEAGYVFADEYENTVEMMDARQDGILMNGDGEVFDTVGEQIELREKNTNTNSSVMRLASTTAYAKTKHTVPTDSTRICVGDIINGRPYYYNSKGEKDPVYKTISYFDYCLGVTAGESEYSYLNGQARRAIVIAIKTFSWNHLIVPVKPAYGIHVLGTMQSYKPDRINNNSYITTDFNAVKNVWMESEEGYIFEAHYYKDSKDGDVKKGYGEKGGALYQDGCGYYLKGKSYMNMLRYYYNDSTINPNDSIKICHVGKIRFFNSAKKCFK